MPRAPGSRPADPDPMLYESQPLPATLADLDAEAVRTYLADLDSGIGEPLTDQTDLAPRLTALGLGNAHGGPWTPNVAGMLLFGRAPQQWLPQVQVKVARFRGDDVTGMIVDRAEIGGSIGPLIEAGTQFVLRNMRVGGVIESLYRRDVPEYPIQAVREAVTNAVAHRDYSLAGQKVQVRMFDDRLEIESPGGLAGPVTLDTLETRRYSRNPRLAQAMYTLRLVEEMGTGIRRIRRALTDLGSGPPSFLSDHTTFLIRLPALPLGDMPPDPKEVGDDAPAAPHPQSAIRSNPQSEEERAQRAAWVRAGLSPRQAAALAHAQHEGRLTNREYRDLHPDLSDEAARLDLADLVERGYLMKIGSNRGTYYILRDT
jgi:ATP-dependent DNA helicase RecG